MRLDLSWRVFKNWLPTSNSSNSGLIPLLWKVGPVTTTIIAAPGAVGIDSISINGS